MVQQPLLTKDLHVHNIRDTVVASSQTVRPVLGSRGIAAEVEQECRKQEEKDACGEADDSVTDEQANS